MVDVMIAGEAGKIHAVYNKSKVSTNPPMAVIISGNPRSGRHMNDRISYAAFRAYMDIGFSVIRFNYRGVGDSSGTLGTTADNMMDIATVIDWIQNQNEESDQLWLSGNHVGAWYAVQTMMRRPEVMGFTLISPDISVSDFSFLSPRPKRGLLINGALEAPECFQFGEYMTQILKRQAQIDMESLQIKGTGDKYDAPGALKQLYNDIKAYVGRESNGGLL